MADIISIYETTDADGDGSLAIETVPNNADLCVVTGMGWVNSGSWGFTELNFADDAGQDFTQIHENDGGTAIYSCEAMRLRSGDTGFPTKGQAATLYFNTGVTSFSDDFHVSCIFVSDADISGDPIRDSEVDDTIATFESSLTGVLSEDLTIVHWIAYDEDLDCEPLTYGQTEDARQNVGGTYSAIGYEQGEDVIRVEEADSFYGSGGAFAIKNAAAGGRITRNTDAWAHGQNYGQSFGMII